VDLKYALRRLARDPVFFVTASVSLALGIGATTAAFSLVHAILLRSLPVRDPASLAVVSTKYPGFQYSLSHPAYLYLRDHASSLDGLVAFRAQPLNVTSSGATERVTGMLVSGNYFGVLGITMGAGSPIGMDDDRVPGSGGTRGLVAVLSDRFWKRRFNSDAAVLGSSLNIDGHPVTIVGVAPPGFHGTRVGSLPDVFVPMMFATRAFEDPNWLSSPRNNWLRIIARRKPAASLAQTQADMTVVFRRFYQDVIVPIANNDAARQRAREALIVLEPGRSGLLEMGDTVKPTMFALIALVGLVLLVACVNVTNLMVARAERSHRDTAISIALGATRLRLWAQSLLDSLLIAAAGVILGLLVAVVMRGILLRLVPDGQELSVSIDATVFGVSVLLGALTTLVLASVTVRQSLRSETIRALKREDIAAKLWLRKGLIVAQLALAVVVLVAAALFTQTLNTLSRVDPGFERKRILIASIATDGYSTERRTMLQSRLLDSVRSIPGVAAAALANHEPLDVNTEWNLVVQPDPAGSRRRVDTSVAFVSSGYFETMGIRLVGGRDFETRDPADPVHPVIVNERFVTSYLAPGQEPIGAAVTGNGNQTYTIVGVVEDSASSGLRDVDQPLLYVPGGGMVLHVRSAGPSPAALRTAIETAVHHLDPNVPVFNVHTIDEQIDRSIRAERTFALLSSIFGLLALVLSAVGLYGVMAHAVGRRTRELGIRLALGAEPRRILGHVLGEAGSLVMFGAAAGLPAAWLTARAVRSLLFGVEAGEWRVAAVPLGLLVIVALLSAWVPARRASRVDPSVALRAE
jgi:predicted permease